MKGKMHQNAWFLINFEKWFDQKPFFKLFRVAQFSIWNNNKASWLISVTAYQSFFLIIAFFKNARKAWLKVAFKINAHVWMMDLIVKSKNSF